MNAIIERVLARPAAVLLLLSIIFIVGISVYRVIPRESAPDVRIPIMYVSVHMEGVSPRDAERLLIRPLEKKLKGIEGIKEMTANAVEGFASVVLEFRAGFNNQKALHDVREKVDQAKAELPRDADEPVVTEVTFSLFPVVNVVLTGDVSDRMLLTLARNLRDKIEGINGVLSVDIGGDREEVVEIIVDPKSLETYSIQPSQVMQQVSLNNVLVAAGALDTPKGKYQVEVPGLIEGLRELVQLPIKADGKSVVTLGKLAEIKRTFRDSRGFARVNGKHAVVLEVKKRTGANIIETVAAVRDLVALEQKYWPPGIQVIFSQDTSNEIIDMVRDLQNSLILATLLVMVMVLSTMGLRSSALVALSIPGSFMLGIIGLGLLGTTLNIVVLFSLILVVGMLVDDTIIVCEYADRKMVEGIPPKDAYLAASKRMVWPVIASTITPIIAFLPLLFWPGVVGQFMKYMPVTVILTLSASLLMAIFFLPVLGQRIGGIGKVTEEEVKAMRASEEGHLEDLRGVSAWYARKIWNLLQKPGRVVSFIFALMVVVYLYYGFFGTGFEFFPKVEPENVVVQVKARGNLSTFEKDVVVQEVEKRIADMNELKVIYARSGQFSQGQQEITEDTIGLVTIEMIKWNKRRKADEILAEIKQRTADIPGIIVETKKQEGGPASGKPVQIQFRSMFPEVLDAEFDKYLKLLIEVNGLVDKEDSRPLPNIQWQMKVNREKAGMFGVSIAEIGSMVRFVTNGMKVGAYRPDDADDEVDIIARFPENYRNLTQLDRLRVNTANGSVPISNFVERNPAKEVGTINRSSGMRVLTFKADVAKGYLADDIVKELKQKLMDNPPDPRVMIQFKGEDEEQAEAGKFLQNAFLLALAGMLLVFVIQFNGMFPSVVIMSAVFFSTVGVLLGLIITNQPFGVVMCGIAVIALAGIVVKNNIIFIDTYQLLRREGFQMLEALVMTGVQRARPILLTAGSAVLGLVPMIFQLNIDFIERDITVGAPASQWWTQLSASIAGGLTFATCLTLFFTPCLIAWWEGGIEKRTARRKRIAGVVRKLARVG